MLLVISNKAEKPGCDSDSVLPSGSLSYFCEHPGPPSQSSEDCAGWQIVSESASAVIGIPFPDTGMIGGCNLRG